MRLVKKKKKHFFQHFFQTLLKVFGMSNATPKVPPKSLEGTAKIHLEKARRVPLDRPLRNLYR